MLGRVTARFAVTLRALRGAEVSRRELQVRLAQQQAVARIGQLALTEVPLQELLDEACRVIAAELHTDFAGVLELLPDRSAFVVQAGVGWNTTGHIIPADPHSQGGYTLKSTGPVIIRDVARETRFHVSLRAEAEGITSGLSVRIGSAGVLGAHTRRCRDFSEHDVTFLEAVASVLASAYARRSAVEESDKTHGVLEAVIEGTTDDVFVKDVDGRFIVLNARAAQTVGKPREELIGRLLHEVLPQQVADMMAETDRLVLERGTVGTFEEIVQTHGETRVLLTTKGPYRARDGTLLGTFGIARDITARKAQEQELVRSNERFQIAQGGARMGIWDLDLVTGATAWSDGLRRLYGVGPEFPTGFIGFDRLLHPDDRERVAGAFNAAQESGADFEFECRVTRPDGALRWILIRSTVVVGDDGVPVRRLGVAVDITERKLAEEELLRRDETLRLAQTAAGLGAWDVNIATLELTCAPGLYAIFGLDPGSRDLTFETFSDFIHPEDRDAVNAEIRRVFRSPDTHYECPCRIVQPSGEIRWVMTRGTVVLSPEGVPERMLGVTLDETERKRIEIDRAQLEIRLRQAEKLEALGQLAGGVAHDFNNLLVAIRGYGELALGSLERGEVGVAAHVEGVLDAADRAAGLTRQLLAFGRRQVLSPEVLDLNEVVRETASLLERLIGDNVTLVTTFAEQLVVVRADRGQLEQVITNLAVNARDAMHEGGTVTIHVGTADLERQDGDPRHAMLSVTDEGSGIDATTAALIFEPFFTTKGEQGTGLGLATVYGIVAQSGGHLVLDTEPGAGSTFSVYLPLIAEQLPASEVAPVTPRAEGTERILLVDDDPAVLTIVSSMLSQRGYEIIGAADGAAAIRLFEDRKSPIELVISDLIMQGLDGRETTDRIRTIAPATKVLFMSGYTEDATIRSGARTAGTGFIQKPFSGDALATCVRELLDHSVP
ncbi:MAG TPA: PAS domain-containing protein [Gaiellaceae bacterium]|nr:PAS domain-containing protein [Gaiellaceae bacterium]